MRKRLGQRERGRVTVRSQGCQRFIGGGRKVWYWESLKALTAIAICVIASFMEFDPAILVLAFAVTAFQPTPFTFGF